MVDGSKADIEPMIKVHFYHGFIGNLTIKDNPDAPELGFEMVYEEGEEEDKFKSSISGLFIEDIPQIVKALEQYYNIKKDTK